MSDEMSIGEALSRVFGPGNQGRPTKQFSSNTTHGGFSNWKKWLGKAGYAKFRHNLLNSINAEIARDRKRAKKASRMLKAAAKGEDIYNV